MTFLLRLGRPRLRSLVVAAGIAALVASLVVALSPTRPAVAQAPTPYSGTCPGGAGQCVQTSEACSTAPCPSMIVGPTESLTDGQYVYLSMSKYTPGDTLRIALCATGVGGAVGTDPLCALNTTTGLLLNPTKVVVAQAGTAGASVEVAYNPSGQGNPALPAVPIVPNGEPQSTMFCDNSPDYCSIVVTDETDGASTEVCTQGASSGVCASGANSVAIPLDYAAEASACPSSDPDIFTDSGFSAEHLIPAAVEATCDSKTGVVAINTATNTGAMSSDEATGGATLAFTDDPWDSQLTSELPGSSYDYIPVALSATVIGFVGGVFDQTSRVSYPVSSFNMTPNMVAGVLTTSYEGGGVTDSLVTAPPGGQAPLHCQNIVGCSKFTSYEYNSFYLLNPQPKGVGEPDTYGSYFANSLQGDNYELSQWICSAPNAPFTVKIHKVGETKAEPVKVTDPNTASATLTTPPTQSPFWDTNTNPDLWPFKSCTPESQLPTLSDNSLTGYGPADTPQLQARAIRAFGGGESVGMGAMDWSEASYWGLNAASLQNAAGNFVAPSAPSLAAAALDSTANANGTLSFNFDDPSNVNAYPMPMITYAVVPTAGVPADEVTAVTDLLTNLVDFDSGQDGPLPGGYAPLPGVLATEALGDIAHDVVAVASPSTTTTTVPSTTTGVPSSSGATPSSGSVYTSGPLSSSGISGTGSQATASASHRTTGSAATTLSGQTEAAAASVSLTSSAARLVLPGLLLLTAVALIGGPVLLAWPRRRKRAVAAPDVPPAASGGST